MKAKRGSTTRATKGISRGAASLPARERGHATAAAPRRAADPTDAAKLRRRAAILEAALEEFAVHGFAAARLDDVAKRANVAKGTIYLYFPDKESLFHELVRTLVSPLVDRIATLPAGHIPVRTLVELIAATFEREVFGTRRKHLVRLVLTEGQRFPALAEFYYREVIARVLPPLAERFRRAHESGELASDALARFPQLLVAPAIMAVMWDGLFAPFAPVDVGALMRAHIELIFGKEPRT